jgi:adenylate cyclase
MGATTSFQRRSREIRLAAKREALWPLLSATDTLNREWGLPSVDYAVTPNARGGSDLKARATIRGFKLEWEELPFEWIEPALWRIQRNYSRGPVSTAIYQLELTPDGDGTKALFSAEYTPPAFGMNWLVKMGIDDWLAKAVASAQAAEAFVNKRAAVAYTRRIKKAPVNELALDTARRQLAELGASDALLNKLCQDIADQPDENLVRMRPFEVAERWQADRLDVLTLFMRGVRAGIMDLRWQVICPHCRGAKSGHTGLRYLRKISHCEFCNIDFTTEFDRSVEARFTVNSAVRKTEDRVYCAGGPNRTPHIRVQLRLQAGATRRLAIELTPGLYRFRATQAKETLAVNVRGSALTPPPDPLANSTVDLALPVDGEGEKGPRITVSEKGFDPAETTARAGRCEFELASSAGGFLDVKLEHADWMDKAATAALVTSMPEFYDLAAKDVLAPDEEIAVRSLTLLFSDLRGSTALYRQIGDAAAYALVREHFKVMQEVIRRYHGGIVKTIGDAVMAVFFSAPDALNCCFEIQHAFVELWKHHPQMAAIVVKLGFHRGPCIAVNFNNRVDYFGTTVNLAARIQNESHGGDIVFFEELLHDPAMKHVLDKFHFHTEPFSATLKGIANEVKLVRLVSEWDGRMLPQGTLMMAKHAKVSS